MKIRYVFYFESKFKFAVYFLKEIPVMHRESLNDAIVSQDNQFIFSVGDDNLLKVWDRDYKVKNPQVYSTHISKVVY